MNMGVIVYSKTGTTLKFANIIAEKLKAKGHSVDAIKLSTEPAEVSGTARSHKPFKITNLPDVGKYDVVLIGGPIWAFSINPVTYDALKGLDLKGKKVVPFNTHGLPLDFLGGKQGLGAIGKTAKAAGAEVLSGKTVAMKNVKGMEDAATEVAAMF